MYQGNEKLRHEGQTLEYTKARLNEIIKCKEDIIYFAENYFKIITLDEGERLIKLWDFQKKIIKGMVNPAPKRNVCLLSSRQAGKSTISTIYLLHYVLFNEDKRVAILANKEEIAIEILGRLKYAFQSLPLWLQQGITDGGWNKKSLILENNSSIIASSTASSAIRGKTINLLYLDEFAFVPRGIADEFMKSVYPTIVSGKSSKVIIVSTPNGLNHFFNIWKKSKNGENNYLPMKVNWWEVPGRDENFKQEYIDANSLVDWNQEFGCVFLGSTQTLVESETLENLDTIRPKKLKLGGLLQIFEEPQERKKYILGIDSASGVGGDYSVIQVLRIDNLKSVEQVAVYRYNMIGVYDFSQVCIEVSKYYNNAEMMIENNGEGGEVADLIWYDFEYDNIINTDKNGIGTRSTRKSKLKANLMLKKYLESGWLNIHDKTTVEEISRYEEVTPNVFRCTGRVHDDTVTSLIWGLYYLSTKFYEGTDEMGHEIDSKNKVTDEEDTGSICIVDDGINDIF